MGQNRIVEHESKMIRLYKNRDWVEIYNLVSRGAIIHDHSEDLPDCGGIPLEENRVYQGDSVGLKNSKLLDLPVTILKEENVSEQEAIYNEKINLKVIDFLSPNYGWIQMGTSKELIDPKYQQLKACIIEPDCDYIDIYVYPMEKESK